MPPPHHFPAEHITTPVNHFQQMYTPPEAFARDQVYPPPGYPGASLIPQYTPQPQPVAGPSFAPAPFPPQHQHQPNGPSSRFQVGYPPDGEWQGQADWDEDGYQDGQDIIYGNLEVSLEHAASVPPPQVSDKNPTSKVKHRRRTTPEQLMVLEHWFDINPKPDDNLREWLAANLGMSKRNVQVWFQNR